MIATELLGMSRPGFPAEGLRLATVASSSLGGRADVTIALPDRTVPDGPVILLLHGVRASHWAWTGQGGVHETLSHLYRDPDFSRFTLVMPSDGLAGLGTGYIDRQSGRYESWLMQDLLSLLPQMADGISDRSPVYLAGLSMGGFGAIRLGLRHSERVLAVAAHSTVPSTRHLSPYAGEDVSSDALEQEESLAALATAHFPRPALRMDCGTEDPLLDANRALSQAFMQAGWHHTYHEFSGGHSWDYWRIRVGEALAFFDQVEKSRRKRT